MALSYAALLHIYRREPQLILDRLAAADAVAVEQRLSVFLSPQILRGAASLLLGQAKEAIASLRAGLPPGRTGGVRSLGFALLTTALVEKGEYPEAMTLITEALQGVEATGEGMWNPELHRSRGLVLLAQNKLAEGEASIRQALELARKQQAKSWSCAPRRAWPGCGASRAGAPRPGSFWRPFTAGSPRVSTPLI